MYCPALDVNYVNFSMAKYGVCSLQGPSITSLFLSVAYSQFGSSIIIMFTSSSAALYFGVGIIFLVSVAICIGFILLTCYMALYMLYDDDGDRLRAHNIPAIMKKETEEVELQNK